MSKISNSNDDIDILLKSAGLMLDPEDSLLLHPKILIEVRVETKVQINLEPVLYLSFARENKPIRKRPPLAPLAQECNFCKQKCVKQGKVVNKKS